MKEIQDQIQVMLEKLSRMEERLDSMHEKTKTLLEVITKTPQPIKEMEYVIEQLQEDLERVVASKLAYVKENNWDRAAVCRDMELYLQAQLEEAKQKLNQEADDTNRSQ